jgi:PAS domain S-box-containing protein
MGKKDTLPGRRGVKGGAPKQAASPEVVSAAVDEAVASARHDAPQEWALLDRVLDGSPVGIIVLDRDLRFLRVNTRAEAMFGVDEKERTGESVESVLPAMYSEISTILADIIAGGSPHVAIETTAPNIGPETAPRMYLAYYYPLAAEGAVIGVGCMFFDVTDQRIAEGALLDSEAERRAILGHMLRVEESERSRLALELHDDTIQVLCALLLQFDGMIPLAERTGQYEMSARLETSRRVLSTATERARKLMFELHPSVLPERGLEVAITALAKEVGDEISAEYSVDVPDVRYPWTVEELAFRVVREAITNIRKHSHARTFSVSIVEHEGFLTGAVQDDGRGLAGTARDKITPPNHLGVDGMKERARLAGGDVEISSTPGKGVRVEFTLPTAERSESPDRDYANGVDRPA